MDEYWFIMELLLRLNDSDRTVFCWRNVQIHLASCNFQVQGLSHITITLTASCEGGSQPSAERTDL